MKKEYKYMSQIMDVGEYHLEHCNSVPTPFMIIPSAVYYQENGMKICKNYISNKQQLEEEILREHVLMFHHKAMELDIFNKQNDFA
mmetsp:Transcript_15579/g.17315  ORF Transcript_15579/g.17315 Transcript_15579/m.17315 type:complete len:86 (-) Transcript_15579:311-568(-)